MSITKLAYKKGTYQSLIFRESIGEKIKKSLDFLAEVCVLKNAFISFKEDESELIYNKLGLPNWKKIGDKIYFKENSNGTKDLNLLNYENELNSYKFFKGFPIIITNEYFGSLCLLGEDFRTLTETELTIIEHTIFNIESIIKLDLKINDITCIEKENRRKFRVYEENSNEILYQINLDGIFSYASKNLIESVGFEPSEVIGKNFHKFIHPDDMDACIYYLSKIKLNIQNKTTLIYRSLHKDGYYVWHSSRFQLYQKEKKTFFIGNCKDITEFKKSEQKVTEQKDFYETILKSMPTDVVAFDINHKYLFLNSAAIKNDDFREYIVGKDDFEYAKYRNRNSDIAIQRREKFNLAKTTQTSISWEESLKTEKDHQTYHTRKFTPVYNADGSFKLMIGFSVDITESKKIQIEILRSRELIKNILNNTAAGIIVQGPKAEIIESNFAACKMLGITKSQLLEITRFDPLAQVIKEDGSFFNPENHPVPTVLRTLKAVNNIVMGVYRSSKKDLVWLLVSAVPVFGENKKLLYVVCSLNNITIQKKTEEAVKLSNERFKYVTEATSDVIWDWNLNTDEIFVGKNYIKKFGPKIKIKNGILTSANFDSLIHPEDNFVLNKKLEQILKDSKKNKWEEEYRYLKADGSYAFIKEKAQILRDKNGIATRMIGAMTDVSTEKKLTDKLRFSEEKFKGAFEYSSVGIGLVNKAGFWFDANPKLCAILGYSKTELKLLSCNMLTHPDDLEQDVVYHKILDTDQKSFFQMEKRYIHKSQRIVWVNLLASSVKDKDGTIVSYLSQVIDITDKKRIESENQLLNEQINRSRIIQLDEAKNLYRLLAENTADLVCLHSIKGDFEYISPSIKDLLGYKPEHLLGRSPLDFAHPADLASLEKNIWKFRKEEKHITGQGRFKHLNGKYIWLETKATMVKKNGIPVGIQSATRDITLRMEADESIKSSLAKEIKLNQLRMNLVSTISHEFRTPMTTIRTSAELIDMYIEGQTFENSNKLSKHTENITYEIDRIIDLMNSVLTISREDSGKTTFNPFVFDLKELCLSIIEKHFGSQQEGGKVKTSIIGNEFLIFADKNLMEYAILNLLNNAFKYSGSKKDVHLNLGIKQSSIKLEIIDFGIGIPKKEQSNLFNTFFRASNTNGIQGTGLGLYIVKTFTEKNSGTVTLESKLDKGTKVTLEFPAI